MARLEEKKIGLEQMYAFQHDGRTRKVEAEPMFHCLIDTFPSIRLLFLTPCRVY